MTERDIANTAKSKLKNDILSKVGSRLKEKSGTTKQTTDVRSRFSDGQLTRLIINAPKSLFIQNYGFEGTKKNTVYMRLKATRVIDDAINDTDVINYLADNISEIRADEVVAEFRNR